MKATKNKYYRVLSKGSNARGTSNRRHFVHNIIVNKPSSGTLADYLLLKKEYKKLDKERSWRYKVAFNIWFLRRQKAWYGDLVCSFCGKPHLKIDTPNNKVGKKVMATVDHFVPTSKDGDEYNYDNMVVSCYKCNNDKDNKIYKLNTLQYLPENKLKKLVKYLENKNNITIFV